MDSGPLTMTSTLAEQQKQHQSALNKHLYLPTYFSWQRAKPVQQPDLITGNGLSAGEKKIESSGEAGQSMSEDDDIIATEQENGKNEFKVLPSCDTLADPIQLDSNNKSIDTSNFDLEKDLIIKEHVTENENVAKDVSSEEKKTEDKLSSLEDVVEKVVELYVTESLISNTQAFAESADQIDISIENVKKETESINEDQDPEDKFEEHQERPPEEVTSPSQSTSSRATRWEALADIAAELPPSLTVDPLTGQIYALSK